VTHPAIDDTGLLVPAVMTGSDGAVVATLGGDLDIVSAPAVRERLLSLLRPGASRLVIDMSAVRYADASGVAVLESTRRRAVLLGGVVRLAAPEPEVARVLAATGINRRLKVYPTVRAALADRGSAGGAALPGAGVAVTAARGLLAQARAGRAADNGELRAATGALLANADAWRDADPRRRYSRALGALAQAHAGASHATLVQAAQSLLAVLGREPLTYSPAVAATASQLRGLFLPVPRLATG
jgi:anti-sigma B factor antagonist